MTSHPVEIKQFRGYTVVVHVIDGYHGFGESYCYHLKGKSVDKASLLKRSHFTFAVTT
jgi:hypothetical protein